MEAHCDRRPAARSCRVRVEQRYATGAIRRRQTRNLRQASIASAADPSGVGGVRARRARAQASSEPAPTHHAASWMSMPPAALEHRIVQGSRWWVPEYHRGFLVVAPVRTRRRPPPDGRERAAGNGSRSSCRALPRAARPARADARPGAGCPVDRCTTSPRCRDIAHELSNLLTAARAGCTSRWSRWALDGGRGGRRLELLDELAGGGRYDRSASFLRARQGPRAWRAGAVGAVRRRARDPFCCTSRAASQGKEDPSSSTPP